MKAVMQQVVGMEKRNPAIAERLQLSPNPAWRSATILLKWPCACKVIAMTAPEKTTIAKRANTRPSPSTMAWSTASTLIPATRPKTSAPERSVRKGGLLA